MIYMIYEYIYILSISIHLGIIIHIYIHIYILNKSHDLPIPLIIQRRAAEDLHDARHPHQPRHAQQRGDGHRLKRERTTKHGWLLYWLYHGSIIEVEINISN